MADQKISPAQRAELFSKATRPYQQPIPAQAGAAGGVVSFQIPKSRLLAGVALQVDAVLTATHSSATTYTPATFAPYSLIKNIRVELNNGFAPFNISGKMAYLYMLKNLYGSRSTPLLGAQTAVAASRTRSKQGITASGAGTANTVQFIIDLPTMLNERDPIGLLMLQNEATVVTVTVTLGAAADIAPAAADYTFALGNVTITPQVKTFSIPDPTIAPMPDLSVIKLVQETTQSIAAAGQTVVKLPVGNTYRALMISLDDGTNQIADSALTGDFELVFNTADINTRINSKQLAALNAKQYGLELPAGMFIFDFGYQGLANLGGFRDYIDTQRLTEFWLRFNASAAGNVTYATEMLSQLAYN
jgi:hypothetical protein